jgi:hypothetical protein
MPYDAGYTRRGYRRSARGGNNRITTPSAVRLPRQCPAAGVRRPRTPEVTASRKVAADSVAAPGRAEQAGDLGYARVAGSDVAHGGARGLVPGLGHDQLERDLLVAEVGRRGVGYRVQVPNFQRIRAVVPGVSDLVIW